MLAKMRTGTKILVGFVFAIAIAMVIGIVGYRGVSTLGQKVDEIGGTYLPSIQALGQIESGQLNGAYATRGLINRRYFQDAELRKTQFEQVDSGLKDIQAGLDRYLPLAQSDEEKKVWDQFMPLLDKWRKQTAETVVDLAREKERVFLEAVARAQAAGTIGDAALAAATDDPAVKAADDKLFTAAGEARKLMNPSSGAFSFDVQILHTFLRLTRIIYPDVDCQPNELEQVLREIEQAGFDRQLDMELRPMPRCA